LKDKKSSPFVIPAIYRPASKIPLEVWQAAPWTTNGNEQAHRSINRDGIGLSVVAAGNFGLQYDSRMLSSIKLAKAESIYPRDQLQTHSKRADRAFFRNSESYFRLKIQFFIPLFVSYCSETQNRPDRRESGNYLQAARSGGRGDNGAPRESNSAS